MPSQNQQLKCCEYCNFAIFERFGTFYAILLENTDKTVKIPEKEQHGFMATSDSSRNEISLKLLLVMSWVDWVDLVYCFKIKETIFFINFLNFLKPQVIS